MIPPIHLERSTGHHFTQGAERARAKTTMKRFTPLNVLLIVLVLCLCAIPFKSRLSRLLPAYFQSMKGEKTVADRINQYGRIVHARLVPEFQSIGIPYPPRKLTLIGLKSEKVLEVWVAGSDGQWQYLKSYPILGASGILGPKLKEGDMQVPEGIYQIESLNPNSLFHLALRVNYPNQDDIRRGNEDGRSGLGSDIMIHGSNCSVGCLAMGDQAAEDLFVLAENTGIQNITVILAPSDLRVTPLPPAMPAKPKWTPELYALIKNELGLRHRSHVP